MKDEKLNSELAATFDVEVVDIDSEFYKRGETSSYGYLAVSFNLINKKTDQREKVECRNDITIYPYDGKVDLKEDFFAALKEKLSDEDIAEICAELKKYLEDPENDLFWDLDG